MKTEVRKSQTKMLLVPWVKLQRPRVRGCSLYQEETRDFRSDCPGSLSSPDAVEQTELGISTAEFSRADGTAPGIWLLNCRTATAQVCASSGTLTASALWLASRDPQK